MHATEGSAMSRVCAARGIVVLLAIVVVGAPTFAQGTASLSGTVRDANGDALPGVQVIAQQIADGERRATVSDSDGRYAIPDLAPGGYRITVALGGFASQQVELDVAPGETVTRDFSLALASFFNNITVTAKKREQEILDVPLSISAVTGEEIEKQGVTSLTEIQGTIPSLSIVETGPGQQRVQIRGISSPQNLPTVGVYMDEMPITPEAAGSNLDVRLLDLERVEVLRGPQGTLYGESSMGGTIKYVTRDPQLDAFGVDFDSAYGSVSDGSATYRASAVVNIPVVENVFGLRVLAGGEHYPGWVDYPAQGLEDGNEGDSTTFRVKGLWVASDKLVASFMLQGQNTEFDNLNYADADMTAPFVLPQPVEEDSLIANLVFSYDAGSFTFLSSTGYVDREAEGAYDFTALYAPIFPPGTIDTVELTYGGESDILTQEFRLMSNGGGRFDWTVGAYYRKFEGSGYNLSVTTPNPFPFELFQTTNDDTSEQTALFGEIVYAFSEKFSGTVGLRYFNDDRERSSTVGQFGPPAPNPDQSGSFDALSPRFVLSYRPSDDTLVYASASKGFRSGGFNLVPPGCGISNTFDPETLWTYEVGSSASLSNGQLVIQGALFHNSWTDIQTLALCPGTFVALTDNVGEASGTGIDMQLTITPLRSLQFSISGGYNDTEYSVDSFAHADGDRVDYAAKYNYAVAVDWSFGVGQRTPGLLHADYQVVGPFDLNFRNFGINEPLQSDAIGLLNARFAVTFGAVELSLWGQNLLDDNGSISPAIPFGGVPSAVRPRPLSYGVGLGFQL